MQSARIQCGLLGSLLLSPNGDWSTADCAARAGDDRIQVQLPSPNFRPNEKRRFSLVPLEVVFVVSLHTSSN
jgi:hypothetical protein